MTETEFTSLVERAGLNLLSSWAPRFIVSLHVPTQFGIRIQTDLLEWQPAEFAMMTREQAESHIAMCKKRLERAAKTKQGVVK